MEEISASCEVVRRKKVDGWARVGRRNRDRNLRRGVSKYQRVKIRWIRL